MRQTQTTTVPGRRAAAVLALIVLAGCPPAGPEEGRPSTPTTKAEGMVAAAVKKPTAKQRRWTEVGTEVLGARLTVQVETDVKCCAGGPAEEDGSPARIYIATVECSTSDECAEATNQDGWVVYLGEGDVAVLAQQTGPGQYGDKLWRDASAVSRTADGVTLTVPGDLLPGGTLRIWSGTRVSTTIGQTKLPVSLKDGSIPYMRVTTDRPGPAAEPWPTIDGARIEEGSDVGQEPWGVLPKGATPVKGFGGRVQGGPDKGAAPGAGGAGGPASSAPSKGATPAGGEAGGTQ